MAIKINLKNLNKKRKIDLLNMEKVALKTIKVLKLNGEVNIVFVSNQKIRALNRKYLNRDRSTDVIAFQASGDELRVTSHESRFLGDIAVSSDKAVQNSKVYGTTFSEEIRLYVIHGILHVAGYEDVTKKGKDRMKRKENELFQKTQSVYRR